MQLRSFGKAWPTAGKTKPKARQARRAQARKASRENASATLEKAGAEVLRSIALS